MAEQQLLVSQQQIPQNNQDLQKDFKFPKMNYDNFAPQQRYYLDLLAKYSGRKMKNVSDPLGDFSLSVQKETFIREYLGYLRINEQVDYNDHKASISKNQQYSYYVGFFVFGLAFSYYMITVPTTRGLIKEFFKSTGLGIMGGYGYYKFNQIYHLKKINEYYILILSRLQERRRNQLNEE